MYTYMMDLFLDLEPSQESTSWALDAGNPGSLPGASHLGTGSSRAVPAKGHLHADWPADMGPARMHAGILDVCRHEQVPAWGEVGEYTAYLQGRLYHCSTSLFPYLHPWILYMGGNMYSDILSPPGSPPPFPPLAPL